MMEKSDLKLEKYPRLAITGNDRVKHSWTSQNWKGCLKFLSTYPAVQCIEECQGHWFKYQVTDSGISFPFPVPQHCELANVYGVCQPIDSFVTDNGLPR